MGQSASFRQGTKSRPAATQLALDLSDSTVTLFLRDPGARWTPIGQACVQAPDFLEQIAVLRTEVRIRSCDHVPVAIWLPKEQVIARAIHIGRSGDESYEDARLQIAQETAHKPEDLVIAVSAPSVDGNAVVLGALSQTVAEAQEYAKRWGFTPGPVSTRVAEEIFSDQLPRFRRPPHRSIRQMKKLGRAAAASAALVAFLFGIFNLGSLINPLLNSTETPSDPSLIFAAINPTDSVPEAAPPPLTSVRRGSVQSLGWQSLHLRGHQDFHTLASARLQPNFALGAAVLKAPLPVVRMRVGRAPLPPARVRPGRLRNDVYVPPRKPEDAVKRAVGKIRQESQPASSSTQDSTDRKPPTNVETQLSTRQLGSKIEIVQQLVFKGPQEKGAISSDEAADPAESEPTRFAPLEVALRPQPRPSRNEPTLYDLKPAAVVSISLPANPEAAIPENEAPPGSASQLETTIEDSDEPTKFAALSSPEPPGKPTTISGSSEVVRIPGTIRTSTPPSSVRKAAAERGLELRETSLIGVLQGPSGRQALIRKENGGYVRVSRGDTIDGWRVTSIGRDTLRLSRRGQSRTLLLVSR